jgi:hypothetical protein
MVSTVVGPSIKNELDTRLFCRHLWSWIFSDFSLGFATGCGRLWASFLVFQSETLDEILNLFSFCRFLFVFPSSLRPGVKLDHFFICSVASLIDLRRNKGRVGPT